MFNIMKYMKRNVVLFMLVCFTTACSTNEPKFYPNSHYNEVGKKQAMLDYKECEKKAENNITEDDKDNDLMVLGLETLSLAATVARGLSGRSNAGTVADGDAIASLSSTEENEKNFIKTCMEEKGYKITGWS